MTKDHTFVNSGGEALSGRNSVVEGWQGYFRMFPDYRMEVRDILQDGKLVAVFGSTSGTYNGKRGLVAENKITMPSAPARLRHEPVFNGPDGGGERRWLPPMTGAITITFFGSYGIRSTFQYFPDAMVGFTVAKI
jgi:hypothetical protein